MANPGVPQFERNPKPLQDKTAVLTGISQGIGPLEAEKLASLGANIIGGYFTPTRAKRVGQLVESVTAHGVQMITIEGDLTQPSTWKRFRNAAKDFGGADILDLNAAGGIGHTRAFSDNINIVAQMGLLFEMVDFMKHGSVVIYKPSTASEEAWVNQEVREGGETKRTINEKVPEYGVVADAKKVTTELLLATKPILQPKGIRLAFLCATLVHRSIAYGQFNAKYRDVVDELKAETPTGELPKIDEIVDGVVNLIMNNDLPWGYTEYVGVRKEDRLYPEGILLKT